MKRSRGEIFGAAFVAALVVAVVFATAVSTTAADSKLALVKENSGALYQKK